MNVLIWIGLLILPIAFILYLIKIGWVKRNWLYWIRPENKKSILKHILVGIVNLVITKIALIIFPNPIFLMILAVGFIAGVGTGWTLGWESNQAWGKWIAWWDHKVIDTIMDVITGNLHLILLLAYILKWR